jgi:hypothetical protein
MKGVKTKVLTIKYIKLLWKKILPYELIYVLADFLDSTLV